MATPPRSGSAPPLPHSPAEHPYISGALSTLLQDGDSGSDGDDHSGLNDDAARERDDASALQRRARARRR
jgi:hypothetical protein